MTVIAAVRKNDELWLVADSQTSWGDFARSDVAGRSKILKLENALIGITGRALYNNALALFLDLKPELKAIHFRTSLDVSRFFSQFYLFLKEEYGLGGAQANDVGHIGHSAFLLATPEKIFCIYSDRSVAEFENYAAVGSGGEIAVSVLHCLYDLIEEPAEILERAYKSCCHFITSCGGGMELINVRAFLSEQAREVSEPVTGKPLCEETGEPLQKVATGKPMDNFLRRMQPRTRKKETKPRTAQPNAIA